MVSTEGNTLTGFINLLRSPIHPDRTVHRLFCIAMLVLASATSAPAQGASQRPQQVRPVKVADPPPTETPASKVANPPPADAPAVPNRSEEHTSELQSRVDLVCRLLLEKKKK